MSRNVIFIKTKDSFLISNENRFLEFTGKKSNKEIKSFIKDELDIDEENISIVSNRNLSFYAEEINVIFTKLNLESNLKNEFREFNALFDNLESLYIEIAYDYALFCEEYTNVELRKREKLGIKEKNVKKIDLIFSAIISLIFGVSLFYGANGINTIGIWTTFISIAVAGYLLIAKKVKVKNIFGVVVISVGILLSITFSVFTNDMLRSLNLLIVPIFILGGIRLLFTVEIEFVFLGFLKKILYLTIINPLMSNRKIYILSLFDYPNKSKGNKTNENKGLLKDIFIGILISIPALIILGTILASANQYFANILSNLLDSIFSFNFNFDGFQNLLFGIVSGVIVFIYLQMFLNTINIQISGGQKKKEIDPNRKIVKLNFRILNTVLIMINGLYLVFVFSTMQHQTDIYSVIAREGFFQLIFVVGLNIIIIMSFEKKTKNKMFAKILFAIMTVLSGFMGISSVLSLASYINTYGLTRLRFVAIIFAVLLIILLAMLFVNIFKKFKMWNYVLIIFMLAYVGINYINMDAYIVKFNVNKYQQTKDTRYLDEYYLGNLSKDAKFQLVYAVKKGYLSKNVLYYHVPDKDYYNTPQNAKWFEYNYYADSKI